MALYLDHLRKSYTAPDGSIVVVLNVPQFELPDGEQVALLGGSGTGKTTLLHSIAGIITPDSGRVLFGAAEALDAEKPARPDTMVDYRSQSPKSDSVTDVVRLSEAQRDVFRGRHIGYIFQTHHLLHGFTALENVLLGMSFTGRSPDKAWARHLLEEVGLKDRIDYLPAKLSLGQQQRVAVARALANRPQLVLADEPTGALDPNNAQQVLELIRELCTEVNASLLMVSHDLKIAGQLSRVVKLEELNQRELSAVQ